MAKHTFTVGVGAVRAPVLLHGTAAYRKQVAAVWAAVATMVAHQCAMGTAPTFGQVAQYCTNLGAPSRYIAPGVAASLASNGYLPGGAVASGKARVAAMLAAGVLVALPGGTAPPRYANPAAHRAGLNAKLSAAIQARWLANRAAQPGA